MSMLAEMIMSALPKEVKAMLTPETTQKVFDQVADARNRVAEIERKIDLIMEALNVNSSSGDGNASE